MKKKKLSAKAGQSFTMGILAGIIIAALISVLLSALTASLVLNDRLEEKSIRSISFIVRAISFCVGAIIGGKLVKEKYLQQVTLTALSYILILLAVGIVLYDGSFRHFPAGVLSVLIGGAGALIILQRPKRRSLTTTKFSI